MLVDVTAQLDKTQRLLRQLMAAKTSTRSEQLSADQLRLFAQELGLDAPPHVAKPDKENDPEDPPASGGTADADPARAAAAHYLRI